MFWYKWFDPIKGIYSVISDVTHWHPDYSERAFLSIQLGQPQDEVRKKLGDPLSKTKSEQIGGPCWHYTKGKDGGVLSGAEWSTHVRQICFNKTGTVASTHYYFYFD